MATLIPAIKAKLGNTEYFESTMKVRDLVQAVRPPKEMDTWANLGIEERMQRDPDIKRIKNQLVPYLVRNQDRFFGSIVVLVYKGKLEFETLSDLAKNVPAAYKHIAQQIGFLTIDGGTLIVLDGQHRLLALRMVQQGDAEGPYASELPDDEVCVIFITHRERREDPADFSTRSTGTPSKPVAAITSSQVRMMGTQSSPAACCETAHRSARGHTVRA